MPASILKRMIDYLYHNDFSIFVEGKEYYLFLDLSIFNGKKWSL
jgi:hypothetical protein